MGLNNFFNATKIRRASWQRKEGGEEKEGTGEGEKGIMRKRERRGRKVGWREEEGR